MVMAIAGYVVAVLAVSVVASLLVPPASVGQPTTIYVDRRVGDDANDGRMPETAVETLQAALRKAPDGAQVLLMGYGNSLVYAGTEDECITVKGTPKQPFTIRRNTYTNTLYPAELTATRKVPGPWRPVSTSGSVRTWAADWPHQIHLTGDPDSGFLKLGGIAITGYRAEPPTSIRRAAWWSDGTLYFRDHHYDPNDFDVFVKNGSGLCISGDSRHVRIADVMVLGAVHAIRVESGARDVRVRHLVRENVLDPDWRGDK